MRTKELIQTEFSVQVRNIEVHKSLLSVPPDGHHPPESFHYMLRLENSADHERCFVLVKVLIEIREDEKSGLLGELELECTYEIADFGELVKFDKAGRLRIDAALSQMLHAISLSTLRGYMFAQYCGTYLHRAILPIIDPLQFKQEA